MPGQLARQLLPAYAKRRRVSCEYASFDELADVLAELLYKAPRPVGASGRLVDENDGLLGDKVCARRLFVQKRHVSVGVFELYALPQSFDIRAQCLLKLKQLLRAFMARAFIRRRSQSFRERLGAACCQRRKALGRREYPTGFDRLRSALGLYVEKAHAVDIVAPELDSHRLGV